VKAECIKCGALIAYPHHKGSKLSNLECPSCRGALRRIRHEEFERLRASRRVYNFYLEEPLW